MSAPLEILMRLSSGEVQAVSIPISIVEAAQSLQYAPERYFLMDSKPASVAIGALILTRARMDGIANAVVLMELAFQGKHPRRAPIEIARWTSGRYLVIDGNSTVTIAASAGWPDIPCIIQGKENSA
jgi:hypothetical protein